MAAVCAISVSAGVPEYKPAKLSGDGTVVFHPMQSISLAYQVEGTALVRPVVQPRQSNEAGSIYLELEGDLLQGPVPRSPRSRFGVRNMTANTLIVRGVATAVGEARPIRFSMQCPPGELINEQWKHAISEVRVTDFSVAPTDKRK